MRPIVRGYQFRRRAAAPKDGVSGTQRLPRMNRSATPARRKPLLTIRHSYARAVGSSSTRERYRGERHADFCAAALAPPAEATNTEPRPNFRFSWSTALMSCSDPSRLRPTNALICTSSIGTPGPARRRVRRSSRSSCRPTARSRASSAGAWMSPKGPAHHAPDRDVGDRRDRKGGHGGVLDHQTEPAIVGDQTLHRPPGLGRAPASHGRLDCRGHRSGGDLPKLIPPHIRQAA